MAEFLPLCDVLFNVISLAGYFCDVVFDVVMGYALLERGFKGTFAATISIVVTSLIISQILSLRWYLHVCEGTEGRRIWMPILLHCLQLGVLWRYAKLFVPVDLRNVKHEVRDLCMLRLVHAFCEAAPMLLLQLHILFCDNEDPETNDLVQRESIEEPTANKTFAELNVISASLSLFSVCWALASFSKNVRLQNVHRLVLTWLGVIFQFLWRLGTITARMFALTLYALVYRYWVFLVIGLHWVSMFLWLISPKNVFHGERISKPRKAYLSALIAFVYVFAYINLQELNHRQKMVTFYCVMLIENCLLVGAWAAGHVAVRHSPAAVAAAMLASFLLGLAFMLIYYRYFHVRRLGYILGEQQGTNSTNNSSQSKNGKPSLSTENAAIPGVFNCRFTSPVIGNGTNARKKKKPTSFVPPPAAGAAFWRKPLPHHHHGGSSENEGSSVGSRVNIQQKLQEKKQKQLAELRVIEEEIKQGKLAKTSPAAPDEIYSSLQRQPIPRAKTHADTPAWPKAHAHAYQNYPMLAHNCGSYPPYTEINNFNNENFQTSNENTQSSDARLCPSQIQRPVQSRLYAQESRTFYENPTNLCTEISRSQRRTPNYIGLSERIYEENATNSRNLQNGSPRTYSADVPSVITRYEGPENSALDKSRNANYEESPRKNLDYPYCDDNDHNTYSKYSAEKFEYISALQTALNAVQNLDIRNTYNDIQYERDSRPGFRYPAPPVKKSEPARKLQRCRTPEILLTPRYLEGAGRPVCCHWGPHYVRKKEECCAGAGGAGGGGGGGGADGASSGSESGAEPRDTPRPPSDIDSQISLPRSYTLPREFRYWRRRRPPHAPPAHNNSSDGDVDSADEVAGGRDRDEPAAERRVRRLAHRKPAKPETKL